MRWTLALLVPALLAGVTGCTDTFRVAGERAVKAYPQLMVDHGWIQPATPVSIDGVAYRMTGIDACPAIWPMGPAGHDCVALVPERQFISVMLESESGVGKQAILKAGYADGRYTLATLEGAAVIGKSR